MSNCRMLAIMGPSGAGKTTLANNLVERLELAIPRHCTTRAPRDDDMVDFYRYLTHSEFEEYFQLKKFLLWSGDGPEIRKEYGNFYGILKEDCLSSLEKSDTIILFTSYKDIDRLVSLKAAGISIRIINLTFRNIEAGVRDRLIGNTERNHTFRDINSRIYNALLDDKNYRKKLDRYADITIFTDVFDTEDTYQEVAKRLIKK